MVEFKKGLQKLLVELCFKLENGDVKELIDVVKRQGKQVYIKGNKLIVEDRNFICNLKLGAGAVEQVSPLMYVLIGPLWPMVFNDVYKDVLADVIKEVSLS